MDYFANGKFSVNPWQFQFFVKGSKENLASNES